MLLAEQKRCEHTDVRECVHKKPVPRASTSLSNHYALSMMRKAAPGDLVVKNRMDF